MRLSLRTLLAFEDNVFDVEQHRRLAQLLPTDRTAEATLQRIRSVVHDPMLGVPGLVDHQEELDPNYVAEYLDHQMPNNVQDQFESYCLSADKYLAEIASVHHILTNVLGEPARTSRDCRLKCYDALTPGGESVAGSLDSNAAADSLPKHFRPYDAPQEMIVVKPTTNRQLTIWNRFFPAKNQVKKGEEQAPVEQKSSLWTFCIIGLIACTLLLGWQQIEKQRLAQKLRENLLHATSEVQALNSDALNSDNIASPYYADQLPGAVESPESIEQAIFVSEHNTTEHSGVNDPFAIIAARPERTAPQAEFFKPIPLTKPEETQPTEEEITNALPGMEIAAAKESLPELDDSVITFQAIKPTTKIPLDVLNRQNLYPSLPVSAWQTNGESVSSAPPFNAPVQRPRPSLNTQSSPQPITQASAVGVLPRVLGRAEPMGQPSLIFTAPTSRDSWQLPPLPFDLNGGQYLLTAAPFRGTLEMTVGFRIEMIGDTKLCILPLDISGVPGIFVDYGRIIIRPLKPNQSLRIETTKSRGTVSTTGTESMLFIDTFAEVFDPPKTVKPVEEQKTRTSPILGFVPKDGERIVWKLNSQQQPLSVDTQGSVLLQSDQYRFGEIPHLPNWLGEMPMLPDNRMLAEACRRCFSDANGNGEQALTWLSEHESRAVRTLGFRLWGDLGRFDIPLAVVSAKRQEDEAICQVLKQYFNEVMRRDEESVHRLADAIDIVKAARK